MAPGVKIHVITGKLVPIFAVRLIFVSANAVYFQCDRLKMQRANAVAIFAAVIHLMAIRYLALEKLV